MSTAYQAGTSRVTIAATAAAATVLVLALALLLAPRSFAAGGGTIVHELDGGDKLTRSQIRSAEPLDPITRQLPEGAGVSSVGAAGTGEAPSGKPGYVEGYTPPNIAAAEATSRAGAGASGFGTFTSRAVAGPNVYPNSTNGRVIGQIPGIGTYSCSASVVHTKNQSTVFTAGHCVKEPGGNFASSLTFVPSYNRGTEPFGSFDARSVLVKRSWARQGNSNFDFSAVKLAPNANGKVEAVVGSQGFAYNVNPRKKRYRAVGYPFNKLDTQVMWECIDKFAGYDPGYRGPGPKPIGIGCDMLGGASGGGWAIPGKALGQYYLNSVTSFGYEQLPNHLYGPQFTRVAEKMRKAAGKR